ncbi:hypothetical protein D3C72_852580 [compost metagenome]
MPSMSIPTALRGGVILERHIDGDFNADQQAGPVSNYQAWTDQLLSNALEYYTPRDANGWPIGDNKFLKRMTWHLYAPTQPIPQPTGASGWEAYAVAPSAPDSTGEIAIHLRAYPDLYRLAGALSHEVGHAHHYWCGLWRGLPALRPLEEWWERAFSLNASTFNPYAAPWRQVDRLETPAEQYANAYRFLFGTFETRGRSGAPTDPVLPGFVDPAARPEWRKAMKLLPELAAFIRVFGCQPGSLYWFGGADGWWEFRRGTDGVKVAQTAEYTWHQSPAGAWSYYRPDYAWA